jgi:membrane associated rhomboid family serine protease
MKSFLLLINSLQLLSYYFFPKNEKLMLSYKSGYWSWTSFTCYFVHFNLQHLLVNLLSLNVFLLLLPPHPSPWLLWFCLSWTISYVQSVLKQLDPDYADRWQTGGASCLICAYMTLHLCLTNATTIWLYAIKLVSLYFHHYQFFNTSNSSSPETDYIGHRIGHFTGFMFSLCFLSIWK